VTLHRLVYVSTLLGIIHFFFVTKADDRWPMFALGVWAVLMTLRLAWWLRTRAAQRSSSSSPPPPPPPNRGLTAPLKIEPNR
jgi:sulfoxide reductase heme-binding subunit YedZ